MRTNGIVTNSCRVGTWRGALLIGAGFGLASVMGCRTGPPNARLTQTSANISINADGSNVSIKITSDDANRATETVGKTFAADRVNGIKIDGDAGDITVEAAVEGVDHIQITATKVVTGSKLDVDLKPFLSKVSVRAALQGDKLVIKSALDHSLEASKVSGYVVYKIVAPKRIALELKNVSADIHVDRMAGGVDASTASGSIALADVEGVIAATSISGAIQVSEASGIASVTAESSSGDVTLNDVAGAVKAKTVSGSIHLEKAHASSIALESSSGSIAASEITASQSSLKAAMKTVSGEIVYDGDVTQVDANSSSGNIIVNASSHLPLATESAFETVSGNVELSLPAATSANVATETVSGSIELPGMTEQTDQNVLMKSASAKLGTGTVPIKIKTSSGNIAVKTE